MHLRKKLRQEVKPKAPIFEVIPAHDVLLPGQKKNIEIKFQPQEEVKYWRPLISIMVDESAGAQTSLVPVL